MKILLLCGALFAWANAVAQTKQTAPSGAKEISAGKAIGSMKHTGTYEARAPLAGSRIYDPTIRALNNRTEYGGVPLFGKNSLLALPKGTYGFAKGQLWLRTTDATSTGGVTGNGSVGTGSSTGGIGAGGSGLGGNGKNPYAGPAIWGSAQGLKIQDSILRRKP